MGPVGSHQGPFQKKQLDPPLKYRVGAPVYNAFTFKKFTSLNNRQVW